MALAACGGGNQQANTAASGTIKNGGTVTIALAAEPDALDPTTSGSLFTREVFAQTCEKLYDVNAKLQIVPQLASALPDVSPDGTTVTIKLRQGITFNDGTPFNADAVKVSLLRDLQLPTSTRRSEISSIQDVTAVDASTLRISLKQPFAPLTAALADRAGMVMSSSQLQKLGANFASEPVCVGPFSFVQRVPGDRIVLQKSRYYYDKARVHLDQIVFKFVPDDNVRLANVESGTFQAVEQIAPSDFDRVSSDTNLQFLTTTSIGWQGIQINVGNASGVGKPPGPVNNPLAKSQALREAFSLAIDRNTLNRVAFSGKYVAGCTPISPASPYFDSSFKCPAMNLQKARQLIAQSGVPTPIHVDYLIGNQTISLRQAQVIQNMVKQVGFDLQIQVQDGVTATGLANAGHYEMYQNMWSGRIDPDQNIYQFWHTGGTLNWPGVSVPQVDQQLDQARLTTSVSKRKQIYGQLMRLLNQDPAAVYLYFPVYSLAVSKKLVGVQYYPDALPRLAFAGFTG